DIKCSNILMHCPLGSGRVHAKISDFGLANKQEDSINEQTQVVGTLLHMAPEMFLVPPNQDQSSDIYALGCEASKGGEVVNILVEKVRDLLKENQIKTFQLHDGKTKGKEKKSEKKSKKKEKQIAETAVNELGNDIEQHLSVEKEQSKGKPAKAEIEKKKIIVEEEEDEEDLQPFNEEEEELAEKMREEEEERETRELMDEAERKRKQGTPFSMEAFKLWKQRFDEEERIRRQTIIDAQVARTGGRLTGKQLFETGAASVEKGEEH
ncbi:MAG: hypothetical protein EZS28_031582, partial [Streblomastix strix]